MKMKTMKFIYTTAFAVLMLAFTGCEEVIEEEEVPLDPAPDLEEIPEEEVPLAAVPKTGDAAALWLALSALSGTGLAGVTFLGRKKRED